MEEYLDRAPGRAVLRAEHHDRFFADLHETVRSHFFQGESVLFDEVDGQRVEITLPPADELVDYARMRVAEDCFHIVIDFPAQVIGSSEDRAVSRTLQYVPPPL